MRQTLLASAALLGLACGPAFAQNSMSPPLSPSAPNAHPGMPQPTTMLPTSPKATTRMAPGKDAASTDYAPGGPSPMTDSPTNNSMNGIRPMRGQAHNGAGAGKHGHMARGQGMSQDGGAAGEEMEHGREYRGGAGSPRSTRASNIDQANTRSEIAPRLPDPAAGSSTPEGYLAAAQRSLNAGQTGAAQEALERAETRLLSRSTDPSMAASPADMPTVQHISAARRALAGHDTAAAKSAISAAMGNGG